VAIAAVAITKRQLWRGSQENFANVYHYQVPSVTTAVANDLVTRLVTLEKDLHGSTVNFVGARVWSAGGTAAENETVLLTDLSGPGNVVADNNMPPEMCFVVAWRTDRLNELDKPVYLRKYYHTQSNFNTAGVTVDMMNGRQPLNAALVTAIGNRTAGFRDLVTPSGTYGLTAPSGRVVTQAGVVVPQVRIHEFRY
jgi:hypothetical protein